MCLIELRNASKRFSNGAVGLDNICLQLHQGKCYGFVGRNGSGKTVLFKVICELISLDKGELIFDENQKIKIGFLIESPGYLEDFSGYDNLKYLSDLRDGLNKSEILKLLEIVGLDPNEKKLVKKYSMGMQQRLGIAQAIMGDPDLLILDEPMNGLDNEGVKEIRKLLATYTAKGKTILIASHNQKDIDILCEQVYYMDAGRIVK